MWRKRARFLGKKSSTLCKISLIVFPSSHLSLLLPLFYLLSISLSLFFHFVWFFKWAFCTVRSLGTGSWFSSTRKYFSDARIESGAAPTAVLLNGALDRLPIQARAPFCAFLVIPSFLSLSAHYFSSLLYLCLLLFLFYLSLCSFSSLYFYLYA